MVNKGVGSVAGPAYACKATYLTFSKEYLHFIGRHAGGLNPASSDSQKQNMDSLACRQARRLNALPE